MGGWLTGALLCELHRNLLKLVNIKGRCFLIYMECRDFLSNISGTETWSHSQLQKASLYFPIQCPHFLKLGEKAHLS